MNIVINKILVVVLAIKIVANNKVAFFSNLRITLTSCCLNVLIFNSSKEKKAVSEADKKADIPIKKIERMNNIKLISIYNLIKLILKHQSHAQ